MINALKRRKKVNEAFKEREKLIKSGSLSNEQADILFEVLWNGVIELQNPPSDLFKRNPTKVFVTNEGRDYRYYQEVLQFFELIPQISSKSNKKLLALCQYLPYWLEHYSELEEKIFKLDLEQTLKDWKEILLKDLECGEPQSINSPPFRWLKFDNKSRETLSRDGDGGRPTCKISANDVWFSRPIIEELINGLKRLEHLKDKDFLISMANHYDENVRKEVQRQLRNLI